MRIGIDFDNTLVNTNQVVREYMDKYNVKEFKSKEEKEIFYRKHIDNICKDLKLKDNALEVLNNLSKNNSLHIITIRSDYYSKNLESLTLDFIKNNNLPIEDIHFRSFNKKQKCLDLNIDVFIDDDINNCLSVSETNITVYLYENKHENLHTVENWLEIEKLLEVNNG